MQSKEKIFAENFFKENGEGRIKQKTKSDFLTALAD